MEVVLLLVIGLMVYIILRMNGYVQECSKIVNKTYEIAENSPAACYVSGELDATALELALAVPESNPLLRAILQVMDGQREELMQDAAEQGIDPSESMARSRGADALRQSADEIWQLVKQANAGRGEGVVSADSED